MAKVPQVFSLSVNVDTGVYKGSFDDIEQLKEATLFDKDDNNRPDVPIVCNDFIVYAYQIFQAKTKGADAIKLLASVLPSQELSYLSKIAKSFGVTPIITVSSKQQLLQALSTLRIQDIDVICITNRNQKLWKIQPYKAINILNDPDVISLMNKLNDEKLLLSNQKILVMVEGFGSKEEFAAVKSRVGKDVDAVLVGEELLRTDRGMLGDLNAITGYKMSYVERLVSLLS